MEGTMERALAVVQEYAAHVKQIPDVLGVAVCEENDDTLLVITLRQPGPERSREAIYAEKQRTMREHPGSPLDFSLRTVPTPVKTWEQLVPYLPVYPCLLEVS